MMFRFFSCANARGQDHWSAPASSGCTATIKGARLIAAPLLASVATTLISVLVSASSSAAATGINSTQLHGFVNQGYVKTDHNQFFGDSKQGSFEFTDIGLGASTRPVKNLQLSAQLLYRRAGKTSPDGVQLDYGLADLTLLNSPDTGLGVRLGRVKNPFGFYNETRDISASRPSILLPESIYIDSLRALFHTTDGAGLYAYRSWNSTLLSIDMVAGQPEINRPTQNAILAANLPGEFGNEKLWLARLLLEDDTGRWRLGYSHSNLSADYQPAPFDLAVQGTTESEIDLFSLEYNWRYWQLVGEYQRRLISYRGIRGDQYRSDMPSTAYYLQVSYRANQHWQWLLRFDQLYMDKNDKQGTNFTTPSDAYARDWTLGVRYHLDRHWLISAELHQIDGTAWLSGQENPIASNRVNDWKLFTAQVSWRF